MPANVTIAVCTFGSSEWRDLANERAIPSAYETSAADVLHVHGHTLHDARNSALDLVRTEYVIYLDADDELEPGYVEAMMEAPEGDLIAPQVRYVNPIGVSREPYFPRVSGHRHDCRDECLRDGNWLVIGTAAPISLLRMAGGWRDFPFYEDWDMWLRCWLNGATVARAPGAIYRAHMRPDSRNRAASMVVKNETHRAIYESIFGGVIDA